MLVEAAIGDAYGVAFEVSASKEQILKHNNLAYVRVHPSLIKKGCYTDDTQMMIAVSEAILSDEPWTKENLADHFVEAFARDERRGYSGGFFKVLQALKENGEGGAELLEIVAGDSDKSGASMRVAPVGLHPDLNTVCFVSNLQSSITHDTPKGRTAALAVTLMVHYFYYGLGPRKDLYDWFLAETGQLKLDGFGPPSLKRDGDPDMEMLKKNFMVAWPEDRRISTLGWDCVASAKQAILENTSMSAILKQVCDYSGDTDTAACIALAIASVCDEIKNDLPRGLYQGLENGPYGRNYLESLDERLFEKFAIDET
jgi:ADP-ribosylglycohydrolase